MKILYFIQCHRNLQRVAWLARNLLRTPDACVLISVDGSNLSDGEIAQLAKALPDKRTAIFSSIRVTWSGFTQVQSVLDGLQRGLAMLGKFRWDYFINLSGECFPMKSPQFINNFLTERRERDVLAMVYGWKVNPTRHIIAPGLESRVPDMDFLLRGVKVQGTATLAAWMHEYRSTGICRPPLRNAVFAQEDPSAKSMFFRPLTATEVEAREQFFMEAPHYCGRAWFTLHREVCEWIVNDEFARRGAAIFSGTIFPDESYLPTVLLSPRCPFHSKVELDNFRFRYGAPSEVTDADLGELKDSHAHYGRKLASENSQAVIDWVDTL